MVHESIVKVTSQFNECRDRSVIGSQRNYAFDQIPQRGVQLRRYSKLYTFEQTVVIFWEFIDIICDVNPLDTLVLKQTVNDTLTIQNCTHTIKTNRRSSSIIASWISRGTPSKGSALAFPFFAGTILDATRELSGALMKLCSAMNDGSLARSRLRQHD